MAQNRKLPKTLGDLMDDRIANALHVAIYEAKNPNSDFDVKMTKAEFLAFAKRMWSNVHQEK